MEPSQMNRALANARAFLDGKKAPLYGRRRVRFDPEPPYSAFDGMLKREIAYCRFAVQEILCEARMDVDGTGHAFEVKIAEGRRPYSPDPLLEPENLGDFLIREGFTPTLGSGNHRLTMPHWEAEAKVLQPSPGAVLIQSVLLKHASGKDPEANGQRVAKDLEQWLRIHLAGWLGKLPGSRFDAVRDSGPGKIRIGLTLLRPHSHIDLDISGEERPDVLRWQEVSLMEQAGYHDLSEAECRSILAENKAEIPADSHLTGLSKSEIDEEHACLLLRYAHRLPDPGPPAGSLPSEPDLLRNPGFIVVENDFWEFHIDASKRLLIGEYRKWRTLKEGDIAGIP